MKENRYHWLDSHFMDQILNIVLQEIKSELSTSKQPHPERRRVRGTLAHSSFAFCFSPSISGFKDCSEMRPRFRLRLSLCRRRLCS